jgi:hypothetical protein
MTQIVGKTFIAVNLTNGTLSPAIVTRVDGENKPLSVLLDPGTPAVMLSHEKEEAVTCYVLHDPIDLLHLYYQCIAI